MKKKCFGVVLAAFLAFSGNVLADQHRHHEATGILLKYLATEDASIQALRLQKILAREGVLRAESSNDVTLNAIFSASETFNDINQRTGSAQRVRSRTNDHDLAAGLNLNKTLLDWGRQDDAVRGAELALLASDERIRRDVEAIYLRALQAYYTTVRSLARVQLREKSLTTLKKKLDEAQKRLAAGLNNKTQLAIAEASYALGESELTQEKSALESALNDLKVYAPEGFSQYIPEKVIFPVPNARMQNVSLEVALEEMQQNSPVVMLARQAIAESQARLDILRNVDDPNLSLSLSASRTQGYGNTNSRNNAAKAALTLNVPLFSGGSVSSDIRAQQQRVSQARMQYRATLDRQNATLKRAWNEFHALESSLEAAQKNATARRSLLDRAKQALKVGQYTQTQVLDEEDKLLAAELRIIDTQYRQLLKAFEATNLIGWPLQENL